MRGINPSGVRAVRPSVELRNKATSFRSSSVGPQFASLGSVEEGIEPTAQVGQLAPGVPGIALARIFAGHQRVRDHQCCCAGALGGSGRAGAAGWCAACRGRGPRRVTLEAAHQLAGRVPAQLEHALQHGRAGDWGRMASRAAGSMASICSDVRVMVAACLLFLQQLVFEFGLDPPHPVRPRTGGTGGMKWPENRPSR